MFAGDIGLDTKEGDKDTSDEEAGADGDGLDIAGDTGEAIKVMVEKAEEEEEANG